MGRESSEMTVECFRFIWKSPRLEVKLSAKRRAGDSPEGVDWPQLARQLEQLVTLATGAAPTDFEWSWAPFLSPQEWLEKWSTPLENAANENSPHPTTTSQSPLDDSDTHLE